IPGSIDEGSFTIWTTQDYSCGDLSVVFVYFSVLLILHMRITVTSPPFQVCPVFCISDISNYCCAAQTFFLGRRHITFLFLSAGGVIPSHQNRRLSPAKEASMELRMRMSVLAAIMSFGFLAAIVLGMI
ncbi:MAG: hypothetical protein AB7U66_18485, partial [Hyphomicrobiaceae bacterium]